MGVDSLRCREVVLRLCQLMLYGTPFRRDARMTIQSTVLNYVFSAGHVQ